MIFFTDGYYLLKSSNPPCVCLPNKLNLTRKENFLTSTLLHLKSKTQTWDPSLSVNGRHRDDDIFAFFDVLKIKVAGVVAKTVQVEEFVTVAVSGVHVAKLKK
jgi:hypothetical protein